MRTGEPEHSSHTTVVFQNTYPDPGMCHTTCGEVCVLVYSLIVTGKESTKQWQNNVFPVYRCAWCQSRSESTLALYSLWKCGIRVLKLAMTSSALGMWFRVDPPLQQKHVLWGCGQIQNWSPVTCGAAGLAGAVCCKSSLCWPIVDTYMEKMERGDKCLFLPD